MLKSVRVPCNSANSFLAYLVKLIFCTWLLMRKVL